MSCFEISWILANVIFSQTLLFLLFYQPNCAVYVFFYVSMDALEVFTTYNVQWNELFYLYMIVTNKKLDPWLQNRDVCVQKYKLAVLNRPKYKYLTSYI